MNNREYIALEGMGLEVGQTRRIVCPSCMGGESGETSMNITRLVDGVAYKCHRASCGAQGRTRSSGEAYYVDQPAPRKERVYTGEVLPLEAEDYAYFSRKYELPALSVEGRIYRSEDGRYVLPIHWPKVGLRGNVLRKPWDGAPERSPRWYGIKADVYLDDQTQPQQALYGPGILDTPSEYNPGGYRYVRTVVVVEDQLSAMKAAEAGLLGVALLGANLDLQKVREIQRLRPDEVILALDADATALSFRYAREFGMAFSKTRVAILERDLKDTKLSDIPAALSL